MSLSKFSKTGTSGGSGGGGKFGGGGKAAAGAGGGKFGGKRAPDPEPEEEEEPSEESDEPEETPAAAKGGGSRFGRTATASAGRGGRAQGRGGNRVHVPSRGRFTGLRSKAPKPPWLEDGKHKLEIVKTWESFKPGTGPRFFIQVKVLESNHPTHEEGELRTVKYNTDERAFGATSESIFMFCRAAAGFGSDEEALESVGEDFMQDLIDAANGNPEAMKAKGPNGKVIGENPLAGEVVLAIGSKGNTSEDGSIQFFEFDWFPNDAF